MGRDGLNKGCRSIFPLVDDRDFAYLRESRLGTLVFGARVQVLNHSQGPRNPSTIREEKESA